MNFPPLREQPKENPKICPLAEKYSYSHGREKNKIRNLDYCSFEGCMGLPKDFVANMCFLQSRGDHCETGQVSKEGTVQFHMGGLSIKQTWLCSHCVLSSCCLYGQVGHIPPPWGQPLPPGHGPGVISRSKGMGAGRVWKELP